MQNVEEFRNKYFFCNKYCLLQIREAQHQNIASFIGACIDAPNVAILTEYCPKGSLLVNITINVT